MLQAALQLGAWAPACFLSYPGLVWDEQTQHIGLREALGAHLLPKVDRNGL